eukprot:GHVS01066633.1.p1 GENE.GHVS01066633.1~~GHVS01066633.1.p1  ORF type:complete len:1043 (+),score=134.07 GHVS01066633.1:283-3411(+)
MDRRRRDQRVGASEGPEEPDDSFVFAPIPQAPEDDIDDYPFGPSLPEGAGANTSPVGSLRPPGSSVFRPSGDNASEGHEEAPLDRDGFPRRSSIQSGPTDGGMTVAGEEGQVPLPEHLSLEAISQERNIGQELARGTVHEIANTAQAFRVYLQDDPGVTEQLEELADKMAAVAMKKQNLPRVAGRVAMNLHSFNSHPSLRDSLTSRPFIALPGLEAAIADMWRSISADKKVKCEAPRVSLYGYMYSRHVTPRGLTAQALNKLSCVEGIVNKSGAVVPKVTKAVYVGESQSDLERGEKTVFLREVWDVTNFDKTHKDLQAPPQKDPTTDVTYRFEPGMSVYKNRQKFVLQEPPDAAPTGQMPRYIEVLAEDDLVNKVKCGDRVRVWGVYRMSVVRIDAPFSGSFRSYFVANGIGTKTGTDPLAERRNITKDLETSFLNFSNSPNALEKVARSLAPSIFGHREIKMGLALLLYGGAEIQRETHKIRGDIHIMLVGDPSCGKSQLLRYMMHLVPGSISATGRGSSGVGLTAAVITDADTGERRVEGGACVMGDRHIVCIDEFDKMKQSDTVAIHEVMEQQTVTIAKAGIHTVLNARCSILAAANPIYGCWSEDMDYGRQLAFPPSLMSRFDLVFIVRDSADYESDDRIGRVVLDHLCNHCEGGGEEKVAKRSVDGRVRMDVAGYEPPSTQKDNAQQNAIVPYVERSAHLGNEDTETDVLSNAFLRAHITYAKHDFYQKQAAAEGWEPYPTLRAAAHKRIASFYAELRQTAKPSVLGTITVRTLEGIVRLATAHARLKLKRYVEKSDAEMAIRLVRFTVLGESIPTEETEDLEARRRRSDYDTDKSSEGDSSDGSSTSSSGDEEEGARGRAERDRRHARRSGVTPEEEEDDGDRPMKRGDDVVRSRGRGGGRRRSSVSSVEGEDQEEAGSSSTIGRNKRTARAAHRSTVDGSEKRQRPTVVPDVHEEYEGTVSEARARLVMKAIVVYMGEDNQGVTIETLLNVTNEGLTGDSMFGMPEFRKALDQLASLETKPIMIDHEMGVVYCT